MNANQLMDVVFCYPDPESEAFLEVPTPIKPAQTLQEIRLQHQIADDLSFTMHGLPLYHWQEEQIEAQNVIDQGKIIMCNCSVPKDEAKFLRAKGKLSLYQYPSTQKFSTSEIENRKVVLLVGEDGLLKYSALDCFINFISGSSSCDNFRYTLFPHHQGVPPPKVPTCLKEAVQVHNVNNREQNLAFQLVDTPGFLSAGSKEEMQRVAEWVKEYFLTTMCSIDAVCFFLQAGEKEVPVKVQQGIETLIATFGQFLTKHFVCFVDGCSLAQESPPAIQMLENKSASEFVKQFQQNGLHWYLQINSDQYLSPVESQDQQKLFDMTRSNFQVFMTQKIDKVLSVWFRDVVEMEEERRGLEDQINNMRPELDKLLELVNNFKKLKEDVQKNKEKIDSGKDYHYVETFTIPKRQDLEKNKNTTCLACNFVCHPDCTLGDDREKILCSGIDSEGYCYYCQGHCYWNVHKNVTWRIVREKHENIISKQELIDKYAQNEENKHLPLSDQIVKGIEGESQKRAVELCCKMNELHGQVKRMNEIVSHVLSDETTEEYFDKMMRSEQSSQEEGFQDRMQGYSLGKQKEQAMRIEFEENKEEYGGDYEEYLRQERRRVQLDEIPEEEDEDDEVKEDANGEGLSLPLESEEERLKREQQELEEEERRRKEREELDEEERLRREREEFEEEEKRKAKKKAKDDKLDARTLEMMKVYDPGLSQMNKKHYSQLSKKEQQKAEQARKQVVLPKFSKFVNNKGHPKAQPVTSKNIRNEESKERSESSMQLQNKNPSLQNVRRPDSQSSVGPGSYNPALKEKGGFTMGGKARDSTSRERGIGFLNPNRKQVERQSPSARFSTARRF